MEARVRPIAQTDLARALEINQANVPEVGPVDGERLAYLVDESTIALAVDASGTPGDDPELAGFCLVLGPGSTYDSVNYAWFMSRYDDAMYLDRVAFDARFQGRGLGGVLYAEVARLMREEHAELPRLTLEVNLDPPNPGSLAFHAKHGFVEVGQQVSKGIVVSLMQRLGSE